LARGAICVNPNNSSDQERSKCQLEEDVHKNLYHYWPSQALDDIFESMTEEPMAKKRKHIQTRVVAIYPLCKLK